MPRNKVQMAAFWPLNQPLTEQPEKMKSFARGIGFTAALGHDRLDAFKLQGQNLVWCES